MKILEYVGLDTKRGDENIVDDVFGSRNDFYRFVHGQYHDSRELPLAADFVGELAVVGTEKQPFCRVLTL